LDGGANVTRIFEALAERLVARGFDPDGTRRQPSGRPGGKLGKNQQRGAQKKGCC